jgi:hypothetical protein
MLLATCPLNIATYYFCIFIIEHLFPLVMGSDFILPYLSPNVAIYYFASS